MGHGIAEHSLLSTGLTCFHLRPKEDHKFKRNDGEIVNQLMKAIAVAVSKVAQWFSEHMLRSLPISTVMPADAQAAVRERKVAICSRNNYISVTKEIATNSLTRASSLPHLQGQTDI